jgi:hypothetical protein
VFLPLGDWNVSLTSGAHLELEDVDHMVEGKKKWVPDAGGAIMPVLDPLAELFCEKEIQFILFKPL